MAAKASAGAGKPPSFRSLMTFRLHRVARISERISEQYYRKHLDLSLAECRVIGITAGYGTVSFKRVATAANLEKSYASRIVSTLVDRGIIQKLANPSDSRSILLELTEQGWAVHKNMYSLAIRLNEILQEPFDRAEVGDFVGFLGGLEQQLGRAGRLIDGATQRPDADHEPEPATDGAPFPDDPSVTMDRTVARQLHDMLGKFLASGA